MADIAEIQLKIKAVEFALGTFADYENEGERRNFLRKNFNAVPGLKIYFGFSENKLQEKENQLQEEKILLLRQQLAQAPPPMEPFNQESPQKKLHRTVVVPSQVPFDLNISDCVGFPISPYACKQLIGVREVVEQSLQIIISELPKESTSGAYRVPPLMFSRFARGGKTTIINEIFLGLQRQSINCIILSFNGTSGFKPRGNETQQNAILRLIASQLISAIGSLDKEEIECNENELDLYIGDSNFVLLIDELNVLGNPLDTDAGLLLRKMFLDKPNRYLVFTTHVPLDLDFRSFAAPGGSGRGVKTIAMPEVTDLIEIRKMDRCGTVLPVEVQLFGGVPSLIYSVKSLNETTPADRFLNFVRPSFDPDLLLCELVTEVVDGDRDCNHLNLRLFDSFSSNPSSSKVRWILCYIKCLLEICTPCDISEALLECIKSIETYAKSIQSGLDWEKIVQLAIIFQASYQKIRSKGFPFQDFIPKFREFSIHVFSFLATTDEEARIEINHKCENLPADSLALFFPLYAKFPIFDGFLVYKLSLSTASSSSSSSSSFSSTSSLSIIGVQMKLGNGCPKPRGAQFQWVSKGYLVRGFPSQTSYVDSEGFWHYMSDTEINVLLGFSLLPLKPTHWPQEGEDTS